MPAPRTHADGRLPRVLGVVMGLVLAATGCSFATRTAEGRAVHDAPKLLARSGAVTLSLTASSRVVSKGALATLPAPDKGFTLTGQLDLTADRAAYVLAGRTVAVFDGKRAFALRPKARPSDARPWVHVTVDEDLQDRVLDPAALSPSLAALALRPSVLVDALAGALTGSIENKGSDTVDGTATTRYTARFDLPQALSESSRRDYSQREQDDLLHFFEVLGIKEQSLHEGTVWLDAAGLPRRLLLSLREEPAQDSLVLLTLDLRMTPADQPLAVEVPGQNTVTSVPSLYQYLQPLAPA